MSSGRVDVVGVAMSAYVRVCAWKSPHDSPSERGADRGVDADCNDRCSNTEDIPTCSCPCGMRLDLLMLFLWILLRRFGRRKEGGRVISLFAGVGYADLWEMRMLKGGSERGLGSMHQWVLKVRVCFVLHSSTCSGSAALHTPRESPLVESSRMLKQKQKQADLPFGHRYRKGSWRGGP